MRDGVSKGNILDWYFISGLVASLLTLTAFFFKNNPSFSTINFLVLGDYELNNFSKENLEPIVVTSSILLKDPLTY